jgi:hypothetical protein
LLKTANALGLTVPPSIYLKQNYEMVAERARGLLSGEVSRPNEHEIRRQLEFANTAVPVFLST